MTEISVSKNRIIKAILTEPLLRPNAWIETEELDQLLCQEQEDAEDAAYDDATGDVDQDAYDAAQALPINAEDIKLNDKRAKDCPVCAVGAVMRDVLSPTCTIGDFETAVNHAIQAGVDDGMPCGDSSFDKDTFIRQIEKEHYVTALSYAFESLCSEAEDRSNGDLSRHQIYRVRKRMAKLVKEHFPRSIKMEINGAQPARDVRTV